MVVGSSSVVVTGKNSSDGSILEVDFEYPDELQELHNDYPLAPEKLEIIHNMLSIIVVVLQTNMA